MYCPTIQLIQRSPAYNILPCLCKPRRNGGSELFHLWDGSRGRNCAETNYQIGQLLPVFLHDCDRERWLQRGNLQYNWLCQVCVVEMEMITEPALAQFWKLCWQKNQRQPKSSRISRLSVVVELLRTPDVLHLWESRIFLTAMCATQSNFVDKSLNWMDISSKFRGVAVSSAHRRAPMFLKRPEKQCIFQNSSVFFRPQI